MLLSVSPHNYLQYSYKSVLLYLYTFACPALNEVFHICSQSHQGNPKVEKLFFTTAIPVGGNAGESMSCELLYFSVLDIMKSYTYCDALMGPLNGRMVSGELH